MDHEKQAPENSGVARFVMVLEVWPSGLRHYPGKVELSSEGRGFKSHHFRQISCVSCTYR